MKKSRSVSMVLPASLVDMGGLPVRQPFPTDKVKQVDPFLLLHHASVKVPTHIEPKHGGVGPHPHRGFSPVTFIFKGGVHHHDSRGNDSVIYEGGTQWMHAGMGIIHSERPPADIHDIGGRQEIIQLWVNSPAKNKMDTPSYFPLTAAETPEVTSEDGLVKIKVIAGELLDTKGPVPTLSPVNAATLTVAAGGKIYIPLPADHHALIYLLDGKLNIDEYGFAEGLNAIVFKDDGEGIGIEGLEDTRALLLSGLPLGEKVESYGPFVMNSQTEILQAMRDYQMGKMGVLVEEE